MVSRVETVVSEDSPSAIAERPAVIEPVKKVARKRAKSAAKRLVSGLPARPRKGRSISEPARPGNDVRLSSQKSRISTADTPRAPQREITADEVFLNTIREKALEKLNQGELELKIADGLRAVELKNKICGVLRELLEEIRQEELGKMFGG
jgi:hypothetical protein